MTSQGRAGRLPGVVRSHVVTGGGRGIGRAVAERLLADGDAVVVLDRDEAALGWTSAHPAGRRVIPLAGDAADEAVTGRAADLAQEAGRLAGWVNNAAVVRYLLSDEASFINGTVLAVDGGRSALGLDPEQAP
jgi:NAD(P)-dependent dehydrogenase (short-subunit alcohol dehydrogenase family)